MPGALVEYRVEEGLAIMELNHPPANTYSYEMMRTCTLSSMRAVRIASSSSRIIS